MGRATELSNGCIVGAGCRITTGEVLPENCVIYGSRNERRLQPDRPAPQNLQIEFLAKVLPNYHHLKKPSSKNWFRVIFWWCVITKFLFIIFEILQIKVTILESKNLLMLKSFGNLSQNSLQGSEIKAHLGFKMVQKRLLWKWSRAWSYQQKF